MKVLVIGSGGREHALCWSLKASSLVSHVYCSPGNGGISDIADCVDVDVMDFSGIVQLCHARSIDLVVIGPEAPLIEGLVDYLETAGIKAFGPSQVAAVLEGSKGFTKDFCKRHGIPTARYECFEDSRAAKAYIDKEGAPIVVKADGLAAGKGVIVANSVRQAHKAVDDILGGRFGAVGSKLVVEECLFGSEVSFMALVDGTSILPLASAQDYKAVGEDNTGPNTGGMGACSPAQRLAPEELGEIIERIVRPTIEGMSAEGRSFCGLLYAGLMMTLSGPMLLEYNVRFGDPECQAILPRLRSDLVPALLATIDGQLSNIDLQWRKDTCVCVVMASQGYPGAYARGSTIGNLCKASEVPGVNIFHAGTRNKDGRVTAEAGRVLGISGLGYDLDEARKCAYAAVERIDWPEGFYRSDIGKCGPSSGT